MIVSALLKALQGVSPEDSVYIKIGEALYLVEDVFVSLLSRGVTLVPSNTTGVKIVKRGKQE